MIHIIPGCLLYYTLVKYLDNIKDVIYFLFWIAIVNSIVAIFQIFGFDSLYVFSPENQAIQGQHLTVTGFMARSYHLMYFLIVVFTLASLIGRKYQIVLAIVCSILLFKIKSYALILAFFCVLYFIWRKKSILVSYLFGAFLITCVSAFIIIPQLRHKIIIRLPAYSVLIKESFVNPFKGYGLGTFDLISQESLDTLGGKETTVKVDSSYNQYLKLGYELGWIPFLIICYGIIRYFRRFELNRVVMTATIPILLFPMFHEVLRFARMDILIIFVFALLDITRKEKNYESTSSVRR